MRDQNEIVTRNAKRLIDEAQIAAAKGGGKLTEHMIAGRMAEIMGRKDTVRKQLGCLLHPKPGERAHWRENYIQALALAIGKTPPDLMTPGPTEKKTSEATLAGVLFAGLNHRMNAAQTRRLVARMHRSLDNPAIYELVGKVWDAILEADNEDRAFKVVMGIMERTEAWAANTRNLRGKRVSDK